MSSFELPGSWTEDVWLPNFGWYQSKATLILKCHFPLSAAFPRMALTAAFIIHKFLWTETTWLFPNQ